MRRRALLSSSVLGAAALAGLAAAPGLVRAADYRALVVLFLTGGNDGHNCLVPTDAGYADYQAARRNLALPRASLVNLSGRSGGHSFGVHPALAPLATLYDQQRLAWIANCGPLVQPVSGEQARANAVPLPPFLGSHSDQVAIQQGWTVADDMSGWAGRGAELLPSPLRQPLATLTMSTGRTLVQGRRSAPAFLGSNTPADWGMLRLDSPEDPTLRVLQRMARLQYANTYAAEYTRSLDRSLSDAFLLTRAAQRATEAAGFDTSTDLGARLQRLATLMPVFKADGYRRQVFLIEWGGFDTHANQRGSAAETQDTQLATFAPAAAAFDTAMRAAGLDDNVITVVLSDFGRTLRPGSGGGSEHGWGNHLFAFGGPVAGGQVVGTFPDLTLGGPDDGDNHSNGRHVPTIATDQLGATLMQWLGLEPSQFHDVFPWLVNFQQKTVPGLLRS